jgi:hypothetical protein
MLRFPEPQDVEDTMEPSLFHATRFTFYVL